MNRFNALINKKHLVLMPSFISIVLSILEVITDLILIEYTYLQYVRIYNIYIRNIIIAGIFGIAGALLILLKKPKPRLWELLLAFFGVILPIIFYFCFTHHIY